MTRKQISFLLSNIIFFVYITINVSTSCAQSYIQKDIKSFGAKGNGKTNDHESFKKAAAYFNRRGGNGKLIISPGTYIVGKQHFTAGKAGQPAYRGENVLHFVNVENFKIQGTSKSILRYADSFKFGAFNPATGKPHEHGKNLFIIPAYAAFVGSCVYLENCNNIEVTDLALDGNNNKLILGGFYGDVGRQLFHNGISIDKSRNILVNNLNVHHFGLDGIFVANVPGNQEDNIKLFNSRFEYNARQGLSWIGGNSLLVKNCKFNHTGKSNFSSPPSAGVDIEAEVGPVRNGVFESCEFVDNAGVGMLAEAGDSRDCIFRNCTFWGATNWSVWVSKPGFSFTRCNIYGSFVHGYDSPDKKNATSFLSCTFEDKLYKGKEPYGNFLIESNNKKRVSFTRCKFLANRKKLFWLSQSSTTLREEKYQFNDCSFVIKNASYLQGDFVAVVRGMAFKDCTFDFKSPDAKKKGYYFEGFSQNYNVDLGGNKIVYSGKNN